MAGAVSSDGWNCGKEQQGGQKTYTLPMPSLIRSFVGCTLALVFGTVCVLTLGGCNIVGPATYLIAGPEKQDAAYVLDKERPTVVFVDDRIPVLPRRNLRQTIALGIQNQLLSEKVLVNVIDTRSIMAAAMREQSTEPTDLITLAKSVNAEVLIYVTPEAFTLSPDRATYMPTSIFRVKVLDVTLDQPRVFPIDDRAGFPVGIQGSERATDLPKTTSEVVRGEERLATLSAEKIAMVFYKHEAREGEKLNKDTK